MKRSFTSKYYWLLTALVALSLLLASCQAPAAQTDTAAGADQASAETILIPFMGPLSGPDGTDGQIAAKGAEIAVDLANKKGGICDGKKLEFIAYDTKSDPKEGASIASLLAKDPTVYGVVADYNSSVCMAEAPIFNENHVLQIVYYCAASKIPARAGEYTYRIYPPGDFASSYFLNLLKQKGVTKVGVLYENEDFGQTLQATTAEQAKELGMEVVAAEAVQKDQTDLSAVIGKIKAAEPEVVIGWAMYQVAGYYVKQAGDIGFDVPFYALDGIYVNDFLELSGPAANGIAYTHSSYNAESTDPLVVEFVTAHNEKFGVNPGNPAGYTYDSANLIIRSLAETNCESREAAKKWFDDNMIGKEVKGATGTIILADDRDRAFSIDMYGLVGVKDGQWYPVKDPINDTLPANK